MEIKFFKCAVHGEISIVRVTANGLWFKCAVHGEIFGDDVIYSKNGLYIHKRCKSCSKERALLRRMGIKKEHKEELLLKQNNKCAICSKRIELVFSTKEDDCIFVDHCHETNAIRGLLCRSCNSGIGKLKDDIALLEKCIDYLE